MKKSVTSAYIHVPFCENICSYCDFCKMYYNEKRVSNYLDALKKEIKNGYKGEELKTIYIGGGTPSSLSVIELERLLEILNCFNKASVCEYTMEVNPENITKEKLLLMKKYGINRISMGVETTNDKLLRFLNRKHDYNMVKEKVLLMKKLGFNNINLDLIYAIPNQTISDLKNDLDNLISLDINHISLYSLMVNNNTKLFIDNVSPIDEDLDYEMYSYLCNYLKEHGFNHYEISNFSKEGYESHHNLVYWHNEEYYGFGLGASGYIGDIRYENTKSLANYLKGNNRLNEEVLSNKDKISYELILGFRLIDGINKTDFYNKYGVKLVDLYNIKELINEKKLIDNGSNIMISYDKIYVENEILINFL